MVAHRKTPTDTAGVLWVITGTVENSLPYDPKIRVVMFHDPATLRGAINNNKELIFVILFYQGPGKFRAYSTATLAANR